jgi:hypothetical protein
MNTVGGALPGTPPPFPQNSGAGAFIPVEVFNQLYLSSGSVAESVADLDEINEVEPPDPSPESVFTLDLLVDRVAAIGHATLYVRAAEGADGIVVDPGPGYTVGYWEGRSFIHPFMASTPTNNIGAAGISIALADSDGPASVTLRDFRIYGLTRWDQIIGPVLGTGGVIGAAFRAVRTRLVDWAFDTSTAAPRS